MTILTSQSKQGKTKQVLEEKLKLHIQREFDLGEKVISLLRQKKALETNLQEQLNTKGALETKLQEAVASKHALEQEYSQIQKDLRTQQKTLRQRSRRFSVTEEDSREDLRTLREEIHRLQEQLELLDIQKVEEHAHLSNKIKKLVKKEHELKHYFQKISHQKGIAEEGKTRAYYTGIPGDGGVS